MHNFNTDHLNNSEDDNLNCQKILVSNFVLVLFGKYFGMQQTVSCEYLLILYVHNYTYDRLVMLTLLLLFFFTSRQTRIQWWFFSAVLGKFIMCEFIWLWSAIWVLNILHYLFFSTLSWHSCNNCSFCFSTIQFFQFCVITANLYQLYKLVWFVPLLDKWYSVYYEPKCQFLEFIT